MEVIGIILIPFLGIAFGRIIILHTRLNKLTERVHALEKMEKTREVVDRHKNKQDS